MIEKLNLLSQKHKKLIVNLHDSAIALFSFVFALFLRLGFDEPFATTYYKFIPACIIIFLVKIIIFNIFRVSSGVWGFSSTTDLKLIIKTASMSVIISPMAIFLYNRLEDVPRSAFLIDWLLMIFILGGSRFSYRILREGKYNNAGNKTLLIGTGHSAEQLLREIRRSSRSYNINIVGIIDDDRSKLKRTLHGIPILGEISGIKDIVDLTDASHAIIAAPEKTGKELKEIVNLCIQNNLETKTLPSLNDLVSGKARISQLRPVKLEDLLGRRPIKLSFSNLDQMIEDKVILVTGAGGSIGSELCNQILKLSPSRIILFDSSEFNVYQAEHSLRKKYPLARIIPCIGDVRDKSRVIEVFERYHPSIVFHAAAYKHVPMMELNPAEAIKTNVLGTRTVAEIANQYKAKKFVLVSTDKAVNPTNVMGSSKRIAEMVCQQFQKDEKSETKFIIVRFGNVLGSAGSVVPRFMDQINEGGPITVTHPDITRFFMSIPEATQLVLEAAGLGNGGEIFVLNMGEPVKILDLAIDLIKLSGLRPYEDIEIKYTGLRPGEKLYEELLADEEKTLPTSNELVRIALARKAPADLSSKISTLAQEIYNHEKIRTIIKEIVPEYTIKEEDTSSENALLH